MSTKANLNEFNGWSNRATWLVALWLNNDPAPQGQLHVIANEYMRGIDKDNMLRDYVDDLIECMELDCSQFLDGFITDLVNNTLCEVNWTEIIENVVED